MTSEERRLRAAAVLRGLSHDFVGHSLSDEQLDDVLARATQLRAVVRAGQPRQRTISREGLANFKMAVPEDGRVVKHQLFSDSIVSGSANPMGLDAYLWREGDEAVMEVTLGKAFEGAPGRAHGGVLAALLDETMGLVPAMNQVPAFTAQLDITYLAAAPIGEPITARARLTRRDGRKLSIEALVQAGDVDVARATALFISVDPQRFLDTIAIEES